MTAVEWLKNEMAIKVIRSGRLSKSVLDLFDKALEMEKQQIKDYAIFAVNCDRKELPVLYFEDYIKLKSNL
jgi:hypothetical protein